MNEERASKLEKLLIEADLNGVSFNEAKQKILTLGYTEDEISIGVAAQPFDGKVNKPKETEDI